MTDRTSSTRLGVILDGVLETGWLAAIIVTPLFFNIYSSRIFEPDKLTTLRSIVLVMAAAWLARWVEERLSGQKSLRFTWRTPLVLPTLLTILAYLISTGLSVTPYTSFFGSYQRLQGTFTTLSYIVIFLIILDRMRTRAQVDRFITTLIINSLPIALYGFVQHSQRDPLPWAGDVTQRVASTMGNAIFVAAYLIMAVPPTLARIVESMRSILTDEHSGTADVLRAASYIFIFLVQAISIWYSQSRGPLMGLLAGLGVWAFLGLLTLQRTAQRENPPRLRDLPGDVGRGLAFGLGSLTATAAAAALIYFVSKAVAAPDSSLPQWLAMGVGGLVLLGVWLASIVNRRGWRWLWVSALTLVLLFLAGFLVINIVEPVHAWGQQQPWLGRLDDVLQPESGTGKVRSLLWTQALDLITPHEPLDFPPTAANPEGHLDAYNALRPLMGYGPESMFVAANRFYPPLLAHYEARTASGDRAHNETMDTLVITGLLGFAAYLWMFGSLFYFGLRWLGFLSTNRERYLFFALLALGAIAAVVAVNLTVGPHFFGLALPVGMVGGLLLYLPLHSLLTYREPSAPSTSHPNAILLTGILATFVAHLVEINFGIAIASTRTTFWALAGLFAVVGLQQLSAGEETVEAKPSSIPQERRRRRRKRATPSRRPTVPVSGAPAWLWPSLAAGIVGGLILGILAYNFVNNLERLTNPSQVLWRALTVIATNQPPRTSMGILMVFTMTWLATGLLTVGQMTQQGVFRKHKGEEWAAALLILATSLTIGAIFGLVLAGRHVHLARMTIQTIADAMRVTEYAAGQIGTYYLFLAAILLLGGLALSGGAPLPQRWATPLGAIVAVVVLTLAPIAAVRLNLRPIQADIVFKQADPWERQGQWAVAIQHYRRAIELAPHEDQYHLFLGRALLEYASSLEDPVQQDLVLRETEQVLLKAQALNPLNTDHSANLARMYSRWAQLPAGRQNSQVLTELSSHYYEIATSLSPNNAILWNEWARLHYQGLGDREGFQRCIDRSLELDREFEETWLIIGDTLLTEGDLTGAAEAYRTALEIKPDQPQVWDVLSRIYLQLGQNEDAIPALSQALMRSPDSSQAWSLHHLLAIAYFRSGNPVQALTEAQWALQMAPEDQRPVIEELIREIQQPSSESTSP